MIFIGHSALSIDTTSVVTPQVATREREMDPNAIERRRKDVEKAKELLPGYPIYVQQVPRHERTPAHPLTPDITCKYTRKDWMNVLSEWKKQIHQWDPPDVQAVHAQ